MIRLKVVIYSIIILLFCFSLEAEWNKVTKGNNGHTFYVNVVEINDDSGHVFFWKLINYSEPDQYGDLSAKIYIKADCKSFRLKWLNISYHKYQMAEDVAKIKKASKNHSNWQEPSPNSTAQTVLDYVCESTGIIL